MTRALTENSVKCAAEGSDPCQDIDASVSKAMALTAVGVGGVAISAIGGALIIYELVRSAPQEQKPSTRVAVVVSPGGGALKVAGSF